ncbi:MAG: hypothetical protein ACD_17C00236G0003 [uncultured bacterium]|nr:MAG: hypothetical protein ACD_17C00236G0003 [uncultured bacterium]OGN55813.1 MAG: hypothetical protein A2796_04255 [Chlamydiae bacterium RIFCSPHIGHO2_01_FULL_44_39]OGN58316.1 MAG: hypothetical protein A3C42_01005 [Chlamydiae bacterium RIFCSPHIGHO2_02_FULL_45_9]OGN60345.1 MAG: hypothetical protein A3D96_04480 [Chlamydiae bacterium RIFCSPHIGHO2_12_FULL_44_59]OGN66328.1 MAG: hypothetical protein A2978_01925 [Chlamydiae bacterium RIFCSPLOWO2_01_FULL_44_52]OGN69279.1 MAG: hypothetical protein A3
MLFNFLFLASLLAYPGYFEPWGTDASLQKPPRLEEKKEISLAEKIADLCIQFHQEVISPVDGPRSHYRPSSSQYMQQAIHNYGFLRGFIMGCDRLLRENDEEWIYPTVLFEGRTLKYDPACMHKSKRFKQ